jgi:hypothetical protein
MILSRRPHRRKKAMSALPPKADMWVQLAMSAKGHKRTSANSRFLILECKKKDRLAAVSPKSDQMLLLGGSKLNSEDGRPAALRAALPALLAPGPRGP